MSEVVSVFNIPPDAVETGPVSFGLLGHPKQFRSSVSIAAQHWKWEAESR